jgi:hypothetical protein
MNSTGTNTKSQLSKMGKAFHHKVIVVSMICFFLSSCIETFEVDYTLDASAVVVTGLITDKNPAFVELTEPSSSPISRQINSKRISGASIILFDDQGNQEQLIETRRGYYEGENPGLVGRSYSVEIVLPDDRLILSTPQRIKPSPSIDSLYVEQVAYFQNFGSDVQVDVRGLNLNLYLNRKDTVSRYYRWIVGGTYQFYSAFDFDRDEAPCYYTIPPLPRFVIGESASAEEDVIVKTMKYISPNSTYAYGHSVQLIQYSQTKESYEYWKKIDDQQNNLGSIFDPPPAQVTGNLYFENEQDEIVMGFFEAASVKTKRVFISRETFTNLDPDIDYFSDTGLNAPCFPPPGWVGVWIAPDYCFDCALLENSTRTKPSYWP